MEVYNCFESLVWYLTNIHGIHLDDVDAPEPSQLSLNLSHIMDQIQVLAVDLRSQVIPVQMLMPAAPEPMEASAAPPQRHKGHRSAKKQTAPHHRRTASSKKPEASVSVIEHGPETDGAPTASADITHEPPQPPSEGIEFPEDIVPIVKLMCEKNYPGAIHAAEALLGEATTSDLSRIHAAFIIADATFYQGYSSDKKQGWLVSKVDITFVQAFEKHVRAIEILEKELKTYGDRAKIRFVFQNIEFFSACFETARGRIELYKARVEEDHRRSVADWAAIKHEKIAISRARREAGMSTGISPQAAARKELGRLHTETSKLPELVERCSKGYKGCQAPK
jgi:hypothetical protein